MILADTDVLIDYLAGIEPVVKRIAASVERDELRTSAVSCFELLSGADNSRRGNRIRKLLENIPVLPLDREAADHAAQVRRKLERSGRPIGMGDSLIAGIALANRLPLYTRNRRHFERVDNLQLVN